MMSKLKDHRTCRIFFSSPFGGMENEREVLTKRYFPQIHNLCNQKGITFVAVDMRWGITSESSANSQVINICLRELDRSDMFVGFFGQRYGWHGKDSPELQENFDNAVGKYPWLENFRDKSVTELEFLHGHLNHPGALPAVLCFRDKAYDDKMKKEGEEQGDKKQVFKYTAESDESVHLMDDLKQRIWTTKDKTLGVHFDYPDPEDGAKLMFDAIWKHLTEVLLTDKSEDKQSKHSLRLAQHNAFLASRSALYGDVSQHMNLLNQTLSTDDPQPIMVIGSAGSGKSTILCNWIKSLQKSEVLVVYHFIGYAENSTAVQDILQQLNDELKDDCVDDTDNDKDVTAGDKEDKEEMTVYEHLQQLEIRITKLQKKGKKTVIVLDGLEKVTKQSKTEKHLFWLPQNLPKGAMLVVATPLSDKDTIEELQENREYQVLTVEPLTKQAKQEFCVMTLNEAGKELSQGQLDRIVQAEKTENPLFLKIVLNELVMFGYFRLLDKKIDSLIACQSIDELCDNVLQRLEEDYNTEEHSGNLVEQVLSTICLSRQGVSESELLAIYGITSHLWSPLYFALEKYLIDQSGLIQFGFKEFKDAVLKRYLKDKEKRIHYVTCFVEYLEKQRETLPVLFKDDQNLRRVAYELPWAHLQLQDKAGLTKTLSNLSVFTKLHADCMFDLIELWQHTGLSWDEVSTLYLQAIDIAITDFYLYVQDINLLDQNPPGMKVIPDLQNLIDLFIHVNCFGGCEQFCKRITDICGKQEESANITKTVEETMYSLACIYVDDGRLQEGKKIHKDLLEKKKRRIPDLTQGSKLDIIDLGRCYHGLAVVYLTEKNYDEAEALFFKALECHQMVEDNEKNMATCFMNLGNIYIGKQEYEKALEYNNKVLKLYEEIFFGHLPQSIGQLLSNIGLIYRRMNRLEDAEAVYQKSLAIKINTVGKNHPDIAVTYMNLGVVQQIRGDIEKALEYQKKAFNIHKLNKSSDNVTSFLNSWENVIMTLIHMKRVQEALDEFRPFFEVIDRERKAGNTYLIDGTLPFVHNQIVKFLISEEKDEEALRILLAFMPTKALHVEDFVYLDILDNRMSDSDNKPTRPRELTLDYAIDCWPGNGELITHKITKHIIPSGDSEMLIQLAEKLKPVFEINIFDVINKWLGEQKPLNVDMFIKFNETAHKHYPESVAFIRNLGSALENQKKYEKSLEYWIKANDIDPEEIEDYVHIIQCACVSEETDFDLIDKYCSLAKEKFANDEDKLNTIIKMEEIVEEEKKSGTKQN